MNINLIVTGIQFDNQLYSRESYDFPVAFIGQQITNNNNNNASTIKSTTNISILDQLNNIKENALVQIEMNLESWQDLMRNQTITGNNNLLM